MEFIQAKSILSKVKNAPDKWFGLTYNMNLYRGCQHQCIYCDSRSDCYQIEDFSKIQVKQNAIALLEQELRRKRLKGTIGTGSMNDPYMPIEAEQKLMQKSLELFSKYRFPVHIMTKSKLVLRDLELIKQIGEIYSAVSFTITTADSQLGKIIEPAASTSDERFQAIKVLSDAGVYCGVLLMPVLPYINDTPENIVAIIDKAKQAGAKYIIGYMGMTLRDKQRQYYYDKLNQYFPGLKAKYESRYGDQYGIQVPEAIALQKLFESKCQEAKLATEMETYREHKPEQLSLF